jgi:flagellar hook-length control protein FliK
MNAAPVIQVSVAANVGPSVATGAAPGTNPATAANATSAAGVASANASDGGPSFAGALIAAGAKSSRKAAAAKTADDRQPGGALPVAGNQPPPAPVPQAVLGAAAALQTAASTNATSGGSADGAGSEDGTVNALASAAMQITGRTALPTASVTFDETGVTSAPGTASPGAGALSEAGVSPQTGAFKNLLGLPAATTGQASASAAAVAGKTAATGWNGSTPPPAATAQARDAARDTVRKAGSAAAETGNTTDGDSPLSGVSADAPGMAAVASAAIAAAADVSRAPPTISAASSRATSSAAAVEGEADDSDTASSLSAQGAASASGIAAEAASVAAIAALPTAAVAANADSAALSLAASSDKHSHGAADLSTLGSAAGDAAAGLSQVSSNWAAGGPVAATSTPTLQVHASVDSDEFSQGLADRVSWMVNSGVNNAKLQVNPPQLGPIELSISVQGNQAQVSMTTHSAVTRDALEASSPQLREMLGAQGFGQVSVDISQRSFQDRSAYTPPYDRASSGDRGAAATPAVAATAASTPRSSLGALDAYA